MCALSTLGIASEEEEEEEEDDTWDDTVLIDAYDKAVGLAMKEVEKRMEQGQLENGGTESASSRKSSKKSAKAKTSNAEKCKKESLWKVGMPCQAVYTEDGTFYEAIIESLSLEDDTCVVKFLGYNNRQSMAINDLFISQGKEYARQQIEEAQLAMESETQAGAMEWQNNAPSSSTATKGKETKQMQKSRPMPNFPQMNVQATFDPSITMDIPPPPPISQFTSHLPADEAEALSSMCMSWYLNGFHTGYYLGLKQGQKPQ